MPDLSDADRSSSPSRSSQDEQEEQDEQDKQDEHDELTGEHDPLPRSTETTTYGLPICECGSVIIPQGDPERCGMCNIRLESGTHPAIVIPGKAIVYMDLSMEWRDKSIHIPDQCCVGLCESCYRTIPFTSMTEPTVSQASPIPAGQITPRHIRRPPVTVDWDALL
jgi:hypothetical protein